MVIETKKDLNLADWSFAPNQTKQLELHIYPVILGGKTRKLYFYDCHLVNWNNHFSSIGNQPMSEKLHITAAGVRDSNSTSEYSAYWRTTYPQQEIEPTTLDNNPNFIGYFITDLEDNQIDIYRTGDRIKLNIETENTIGKTITFSLNDKTHDFKHNGVILQNDTLKDYPINNDTEQVELEVIDQQN